jgi:hypothetical protein
LIARYQRIFFWTLLGLSVLMAGYLIYLHQHVRTNASLQGDNTPIEAPESSGAENITFATAHDSDGTITNIDRSIALPGTSAVRARALLEHLLADYALPTSEHRLPGGIAVDDVFLVSLPLMAPQQVEANSRQAPQLPSKAEDADPLTHASGELAVVNLRGSWVETHPSGIESETLTLLSIIGTLHANLPAITQVRFLVDGQTRATLAGHVNLARIYPSIDTSNTTASQR